MPVGGLALGSPDIDVDLERLLSVAEGLDRRELAELLSEIMREMLDEGTPEDELLNAYASLCRRLGIEIGHLRRSLH